MKLKDIAFGEKFVVKESHPNVWTLMYEDGGVDKHDTVLCENINKRWPCDPARFPLNIEVTRISDLVAAHICAPDKNAEILNAVVPPFGMATTPNTLVDRTQVLEGQHRNQIDCALLISELSNGMLRGFHPKYALQRYVDELVRAALWEAVEGDEYLCEYTNILADTLNDTTLKNLIARSLVDMRANMGDSRTLAAQSILKDVINRMEQAGSTPLDQVALLLANIGPEAVAHIVHAIERNALSEQEQELIYHVVYDKFVVKQSDEWLKRYYVAWDAIMATEKTGP